LRPRQLAADAQGKFWEMRDQLFNHQSAFERSLLDEYAAAAGLDVRRFDGDFGQRSGKAIVDADEDLGNRLGIGTAPMLFINGRPVLAFEPYENIRNIVDDEIRRADDLLTGGAGPGTLYAAFLAHAHRSLASVPKSSTPPSTEIYAVGIDQAPVRGAAQPKVTVIAFFDFQCPYSARASQTLSEVAKEYPDEVPIFFRHLPLEFHRQAIPAALAAEAAREQGKFWEMHDLLFARQEALDIASIETYAKEVGLDLAAFRRSLADSAGKRHVDDDVQLAERFGVRGAPYFFVNGRTFRASQPAPAWRGLIEEEIKNADDRLAAGTPRARLYAEITRNGLGATLTPLVNPRRPGRSRGGAKTRGRCIRVDASNTKGKCEPRDDHESTVRRASSIACSRSGILNGFRRKTFQLDGASLGCGIIAALINTIGKVLVHSRARTRLQNSSPFIVGIMKSTMIQLGRSDSRIRRPSDPFGAVSTARPSQAKISDSDSTNANSSSMTRTLFPSKRSTPLFSLSVSRHYLRSRKDLLGVPCRYRRWQMNESHLRAPPGGLSEPK
jgi:protein-disulfide isomerase